VNRANTCPPKKQAASTKPTARKAGFVEAVPSHTFRDGTGIFVITLRRPEVSAIKD
jgi:hypothetical protein